MRILYGAGNRVGANSQLYRFLKALGKEHTVSVAAWAGSSYLYSHLNWTLEALNNNIVAIKKRKIIDTVFGHTGAPRLNVDNLKVLLKEVEDFEPDLVISDCDLITANVAKSLDVKLWYCSPVHLLNGMVWEKDQLRYKTSMIMARKTINKLPTPNRILVYSPFGDIKLRPELKLGFEWVRPYYIENKTNKDGCIAIVNDSKRFPILTKILNGIFSNINLFSPFKEEFSNLNTYLISDEQKYNNILGSSNIMFTTGETSYISDAFYSGHNICVAPSLNDVESLLNARLVQFYKLGTDLHQIEYMEHYAVHEIEESFKKEPRRNYLSSQNRKQLHEEICNI